MVRDATLVIIASEDRYAVKQYFEFFRSTRIQFRVLETTDGRSAPQHVLGRLEEYIKEFEFGEGDQFWLVCDMDHWSDPSHISNLAGVLQKCRHKGIQVALSNPCFDLWLLLHFSDVPDDIRAPTCNVIETEIRKVVGQYSKTKVYDLPISMERVRDAITRAKTSRLRPRRERNSSIVPPREEETRRRDGVRLLPVVLFRAVLILVAIGKSPHLKYRPNAGKSQAYLHATLHGIAGAWTQSRSGERTVRELDFRRLSGKITRLRPVASTADRTRRPSRPAWWAA